MVVSNNFVGLVIPLKKCSDEKWAFSEEMHIEKIHFWNEKTDEKLKWKIVIIIFFFFQSSAFLIFVKIWTPAFRFYFWLINLRK